MDPVEVGRVLRPHGVRGEAVVEPFSEVPERFSPGAELLAAVPGTPLGSRRSLKVESVRPHRGALLIGFAGVAGRDAVEALRGALLEVPREAVPEAPEGRTVRLELAVDPEDLGKVIGRQGRTARALRALLDVRGAREGARYELKILEEDER